MLTVWLRTAQDTRRKNCCFGLPFEFILLRIVYYIFLCWNFRVIYDFKILLSKVTYIPVFGLGSNINRYIANVMCAVLYYYVIHVWNMSLIFINSHEFIYSHREVSNHNSCRGSWPRTPSLLKTNDPAKPRSWNAPVRPEIRDLQRMSDDKKCMAPLSHRRGCVPHERRPSVAWHSQ